MSLLVLLGDRARAEAPFEFFAFFNGLPSMPLEEEAALLHDLGYQGISQVYRNQGGERLAQRVAAYRKHDLKVLSIYLDVGDPIDSSIYRALSESGGFIELTVKKDSPNLVDTLRRLAAEAEKENVRIALYPHYGFKVATMGDAMDLAEKVKHPNLGVMFNLCHFLKSENLEDLEATLEAAAGQLFLVSTCGADRDGENWSELIQTLDRGSFSQSCLLDALEKINYRGPVTLQGYGIKGDKKENLSRSMDAWKKLF